MNFCAKFLGKRSTPSCIFYKIFQCNCDILIMNLYGRILYWKHKHPMFFTTMLLFIFNRRISKKITYLIDCSWVWCFFLGAYCKLPSQMNYMLLYTRFFSVIATYWLWISMAVFCIANTSTQCLLQLYLCSFSIGWLVRKKPIS